MRIGKIIATGLGVIAIMAGIGMTAAGAIAVAVTDADGWINAPTVRISSEEASALVADDIDIELEKAIEGPAVISFDDFDARVEVESRNGKEVFIGVAPSSDVGAYLAGSGYARVEMFRNDDVDLVTVPGVAPLAAPNDQTFWASSATDGSLEWDLESGEWTVAVANADGSPGVDVSVTGAAHVPFAEAIGIGLLIGGVFLVVGGGVLLYLGVRSVRSPAGPAAPPAAPIQEPTEPQPVG